MIEQLGGYERAKHEFKMIEEMTPRFPDEVKTNNRLLLEYRREHNIFEVGDDVVFCNFLKGVSQKWLGETFKVIHVYEDEDVAAVSSSGVNTHLTLYTIKHATDAEIKAGVRV